MVRTMLPSGHVEFTWAALNLLQRQAGLFEDADYRLAALAAVLPDLLDKPLATFVLTDAEAAPALRPYGPAARRRLADDCGHRPT